MGTGRDDFSQDTIRKAAMRVGYHCSFPGCLNATVGASMESASKVSMTGVAAHICAAAKGGPRYDANMTAQERSGIENCIWLCQTHSKLIDTDVKKYTVDLVRKWKSEAENRASKELANSDYFSEYYKGNGDNLNILEQLFDDFVSNGQFKQLDTMLKQYKSSLSEQYEEFVLRYKIIYDIYCSREDLPAHLQSYCALPCKSGVDMLAELFLSFHMLAELKTVESFCTDPVTKEYVSMEMSGSLIKQLLVPGGSQPSISLPDKIRKTIAKYITNQIISGNLFNVTDSDGKPYRLYSDEFYYRVVPAAFELAHMIFFDNADFNAVSASMEFQFIKDNLEKIGYLDYSLQEYIWEQFLLFLSADYDQFQIYYSQCPVALKKIYSIQRAEYICRIGHDSNMVHFDELVAFADKSEDDNLLCLCLSHLDPNTALHFLEDHAYLFRRNSCFLKLKIQCSSGMLQQNIAAFLEKYEDEYKNDFLYHCLVAQSADTSEKKQRAVEWLQAHRSELKHIDIMEYIRALRGNAMWDDLAELTSLQIPNECKFYLAGYLTESDEERFLNISLAIYQDLRDSGWVRKDLNLNIGILQRHLGYVEEAKSSFIREYNDYHSDVALRDLIYLRYETCEYIIDDYFEIFKSSTSAESQNLVGAVYLKLCNYGEARKYFLRSLLIADKDNRSIHGLYQAVSKLPEEQANVVKENTVCILKNEQSVRQIAIHTPDILEGVSSPSQFADCVHYSVEDDKISELRFQTPGENVSYNGEMYALEAIFPANVAFLKFYFKTLCNNQSGVITIKGETADELVENIIPILKSSTEELDAQIQEYNYQEIHSLAILSSILGKSMLLPSEFLMFENKERIRNNLAIFTQEDGPITYVLSYDAIMYLAHIDIELDDLEHLNLLCATQVKNQLINDINEELVSLSDERQKGKMYYDGGRLSVVERSAANRRARYAFLSRLKKFLNKIPSRSCPADISSTRSEIKGAIDQLVSKQKLYCERETLSITQKTPGGVLVTDDQLLYGMASVNGISNIGLTGFFSSANFRWDKLLAVSKQLNHINFLNYLPLQLYKQIVDQMLKSDADKRNASAEIFEWLRNDSENTPVHENVILRLFRDVYDNKLNYLNPGNYLGNLAISIFEQRNPGFIKKSISEFLGSLESIKQHQDN